jgi:hypothetical protein
MTPTEHAIKAEIYKAVEELGAKPDLLSCVASWGTTQTDEQVLERLRAYNQTGDIKPAKRPFGT